MTKETLFEAIGQMDDDILVLSDSSAAGGLKVLSGGQRGKTRRFSPMAKQWMAVAACLVVVVIVGAVWKGISSTRMGKSANDAMSSMSMSAAPQVNEEMVLEAAEEADMDAMEEGGVLTWGTTSSTVTYGSVEELMTSNQAVYVDPASDEKEESALENREALWSVLTGSNGETNEAADQTQPGAAGGRAEKSSELLYQLSFEEAEGTVIAYVYADGEVWFEGDAVPTISLNEEQLTDLIQLLEGKGENNCY